MIGNLTSQRAIEETVEQIGILPFFRNQIRGWSIEEHTPAELWFVKDTPGPWEWKGPIIQNGRAVYGKFIDGKAAFVRIDLFPHLMNIRRAGTQMTADQADVVSTISANESLLTTEIREMCGFGRANDIEVMFGNRAKKPNLDTLLGKLQMMTRIVVADFEYKRDKKGRPYGWGLARYATPETLYAGQIEETTCDVEESRRVLTETMRRTIGAKEEEIGRLF